jgi:hypothetical protein
MDIKYSCKYCNTHSTTQYNYSKHLKTKLHANNVKDYEDKMAIIKALTCDNCGKKYKTLATKKIHSKSCTASVPSELILLKQNTAIETIENYKLNAIISKIDSLSAQVNAVAARSEKNISSNVNKIAAKGENMLKKVITSHDYIIKNFGNAPPLEDFSDYALFGKGDAIITTLIQKNNNKSLKKYIGDIIISVYKKNIVSTQSIWNTDYRRHKYIIKEADIIDSDAEIEDDDYAQNSSWDIDEEAENVKSYIIYPIIKFLRTQITNQLNKNAKECEKNVIGNRENSPQIIKYGLELTNLKTIITSDDLVISILNYISPQFNLKNVIGKKNLNT